MVAGFVIVPVVSMFTRIRNPKQVDDMFECYNHTVVVMASTSLGDEK